MDTGRAICSSVWFFFIIFAAWGATRNKDYRTGYRVLMGIVLVMFVYFLIATLAQ